MFCSAAKASAKSEGFERETEVLVISRCSAASGDDAIRRSASLRSSLQTALAIERKTGNFESLSCAP
eukprot:4339553-Pyramimonas_sp.AAC.1